MGNIANPLTKVFEIFEIDFVIEIKWYLTFWPFLRAPEGGAKKFFVVACHIHVSNSHTEFGWISSSGLGDSITDRRTDGGDYNIPFAFLKKRGDNYSCHGGVLHTKLCHQLSRSQLLLKMGQKL